MLGKPLRLNNTPYMIVAKSAQGDALLPASALAILLFLLQANLLFEAQLIENTTCSLLPLGMNSLPPRLAADACRNVGAALVKKVEERMQPNQSGAAKSVRAAWEQAHAVLLLQAIGHPAAERFGLPNPAEASQAGQQYMSGH